MYRRWMRCVVALGGTLALTLPTAGIAHADPLQYLVNLGGSDAAARGTTAGVAMVDRVTGIYSDNGANAHLRFGSASLVKLFIADSVLHRARLGQIRLTSADMSSLSVMLRSSDDNAANSFWSRFGSSGIVNDVKSRYRLAETAAPVNPRYWGLTQVTAHDLAAFYRGMLNGAGGLAPADRDFIVAQLRASTSHGTDGYYQWFGLHDALSREPVVGIKQGWMCCFSDGYIWRHSTGLVGPDARYIVVVLTRDRSSAGAAHTVTSVTHAVQRMFPAGLIPRVNGAIGDHWYAIGGPSSRLGLPTASEANAVGGRYSPFQRGAIYWSPASGAYLVAGAIGEHWAAIGAENSRLGYPTADELPAAGGAYSRFQRGFIYWSGGTGAHLVAGGILDAWNAQGHESGHLGYPLTDEAGVPGGAFSNFQHGVIYWSPATGAHWLDGAILDAWAADGYQAGALGFPASDPHAVAGGTQVDFQYGSLTLTTTGQVQRVVTTPPAPATASAPAVASASASRGSATTTGATTTGTATTGTATTGAAATGPATTGTAATTGAAAVTTGPAR